MHGTELPQTDDQQPSRRVGSFLEAPVERATEGYTVYFLRCGECIKIGVAKQLNNRISGIQTGSPVKMALEAVLFVDSAWVAHKIEKALHAKCKDDGLHVRGEWFSLTRAGTKSMMRWAKTIHPDWIFASKLV